MSIVDWDASELSRAIHARQVSCEDVLRAYLAQRGGAWQVLAEPNLMCARNEELCKLDEALADGDEVAFFPPVTGG